MAERKRSKKPSRRKIVARVVDQDEPLSPEWTREIKRRARELESPVRYIISSAISPKFVFFYNASTDTFAVNKPENGTLFKRREVATRVAEVLGKGHRAVRFTTRNGVLKRLSPYNYRLGSGRRKVAKPRSKASLS
jgi:hypothetical protein